MRQLLAVASREYASFFRVPLGWIVVALFACLSSVIFSFSEALAPGAPATMRSFFGIWWGLLLVICPAISMRLLSEELRTGTMESVLTAPIPDGVLVAGKYLAAVGFLATTLVPTLAYVAVLEWLSRPDYGPILSGYLGLMLLGMLYLAVGTLASSLTSSQSLAFLGTLFALILIDIVPAQVAPVVPERLSRLLFALAPNLRVRDFARGLIDSSHIAFFLAASFWFLTLAAVTLQSRRWR